MKIWQGERDYKYHMRTRAIILKKQNTNEYDQLVTCYTQEFGKITAIAKSILKPNSIQAMHLDVFNLVDFDLINGRSLPIITGAQVENSNLELKNSLSALAIGYFFIEVIDKIFFDYQRDDSIWDFLNRLLKNLNDKNSNLKELLSLNKKELVSILGYAPNISQCAFCLKNDLASLIAYSIHAKGVVCKDCFLSGQEAVVIKNQDFGSDFITETIFESIAERKINSLNFVKTVVK